MSEGAKASKSGLQFDEQRPPAEPRPAATVIVLRQGRAPSGVGQGKVELFCVRRHQGSAFMGGAVVFPGGKVDEADRDPTFAEISDPVSARALALASNADEARALAIAAARESLEEAGIAPIAADAATMEALRGTAATAGTFRQLLAARNLRLALGALVPFARWVTPTAEPRRFDARFYLLAMPENQEGRHDEHETTASFWASPEEVLAKFDRGEIQLFPPTTRSLEMLRGIGTVAEALALAETRDLRPVCPRFVPSDPPMLTLPGDPTHEEREVIVPGPSRFVLRDGRFVSESP